MASSQLVVPHATSTPQSRHLSALSVGALVGAPMIGISLLLSKLGYIRNGGPVDGFLSLVYMAGFLCAAVGLRCLRVTGRGKTGLIVSGVQIVALVMAEIWAFLTMIGSPQLFRGVLNITDLGWPFSHVFMLVVGVAAWRAKVWTGWPLCMIGVCGCALPASMGFQRVAGDLGLVLAFGILTAVPMCIIALQLRAADSEGYERRAGLQPGVLRQEPRLRTLS